MPLINQTFPPVLPLYQTIPGWLLLCALLISTPVNAEQSIQQYGEDFYMAYTPNNAEDILSRVPGAQVVVDKADTGGRGFNENSQLVLINGRPVSAKSNGIKTILARIAAENVERVDIIRGGVDGLNIKRSETVVNLVLRDQDSLDLSWDAKVTGYEEGHQAVNGGLFFNRQQGSSNWIAGLELFDRGKPEFEQQWLYSPQQEFESAYDRVLQEAGWSGKLSSTLSWLDKSSNNVQLNVLYEDIQYQGSKDQQQLAEQLGGLSWINSEICQNRI
ncbi:TonB-dependent receptor plug domain-containing protein [Oceanicoccus sp. KOV_DT_Chl]|uniref:TonB-dependent receptor plug domain-containing protein n=1 Tax=Oceanicoccus sp. KOV_DT_Chl TaxID=1904639 RepID=UPI000C7C2300|nr:TonB-dependent receptor plug domain-containing protein [Oceanicoccus sp. KOV_DT_Chl]